MKNYPNLLDMIIRYHNGESLAKIARTAHTDPSTLRRSFAAAGVNFRTRADAVSVACDRRYAHLDWPALAQRYLDGESVEAIARSLGLKVWPVLSRLRKLVPMRDRSECRQLTTLKKALTPGLDELAAEHMAGVPLKQLARRIGVMGDTLARRFRYAGHPIRTGVDRKWRKVIPVDELVSRYAAGESILALSRHYGVSREAIGMRLQVAGVTLRGCSEANQQKSRVWAGRAVTRHLRKHCVTPTERTVAEFLEAAGEPIEQQYPVENFNLDIAYPGELVAVEVETGTAFRYPWSVALWERARFLTARGWSVLFVVSPAGKLDLHVIRDRLAAFRRHVRELREPAGVYGVIRYDGKPMGAERYHLEGMSRVDGF